LNGTGASYAEPGLSLATIAAAASLVAKAWAA